MLTITASELRHMLQQVTPHMDPDEESPLHAVRLEQRNGWLYAVATDRYTLAVTRRPVLNDGDARTTLPGHLVPTLNAWLGTAGIAVESVDIVLNSVAGAEFAVPEYGKVRLDSDPDQYRTVPDWRPLVLAQLVAELGEVPLTMFTTKFLARWEHADVMLAAWQTGPKTPLILTDRKKGYFLGMQMPRSEDHLTRDEIVAPWRDAVSVVTVAGIEYDLRATWLDAQGDPWTWNGEIDKINRLAPLMVLDGIDTDPHPLAQVITEYGPLTRA